MMGLVLIMGTMVVWWRDVIREETYQECHTGIVGLNLEGGRARVPYRYCRAVFRGGQG